MAKNAKDGHSPLGARGPGMNYKPNERDKYLVKDEFAQLVEWADKHDLRLALFVFLGGVAGLRITEARTLPWAAFDRIEGEGMLSVRCLKKRKKLKQGGAAEVIMDVALGPKARVRVLGYMAKLRKPGDQWPFPGRDGKPLSIRQATRWFKTAALGAGLNPKYSYHALRHYRGISAWEANREMKIVASLLRHVKEETSYKYMHMSQKEKHKAVEKIEEI
jgi:integrase